MHFNGLVAGKDFYKELSPFAEYSKSEVSKRFIDPEEIDDLCAHCKVDKANGPEVVSRIKEYIGFEGGIENGKYFYLADENPHKKFNYAGLSEDEEIMIKLKKPKVKRHLLLFKKDILVSNQSQISEVEIDAINFQKYQFILINGAWIEDEEDGKPMDPGKWAKEIKEKISSLPKDTMLSVVKCHS